MGIPEIMVYGHLTAASCVRCDRHSLEAWALGCGVKHQRLSYSSAAFHLPVAHGPSPNSSQATQSYVTIYSPAPSPMGSSQWQGPHICNANIAYIFNCDVISYRIQYSLLCYLNGAYIKPTFNAEREKHTNTVLLAITQRRV